jgi:TRAP-type C4-dicarboxylate transport system permease small subunit
VPVFRAAVSRISALLETALKWAVAAAVAGVVVIVFADAAGRHLLTAPTYWNSEVSRLLLIWITYLGAALLVRRGALIRIDVIHSIQSARYTRWTEQFSFAVTVIVLACMVLFAWPLLVVAVGKQAPATGWPYLVFYLSLPVFSLCGLFFLLDRALNGVPLEPNVMDTDVMNES